MCLNFHLNLFRILREKSPKYFSHIYFYLQFYFSPTLIHHSTPEMPSISPICVGQYYHLQDFIYLFIFHVFRLPSSFNSRGTLPVVPIKSIFNICLITRLLSQMLTVQSKCMSYSISKWQMIPIEDLLYFWSLLTLLTIWGKAGKHVWHSKTHYLGLIVIIVPWLPSCQTSAPSLSQQWHSCKEAPCCTSGDLQHLEIRVCRP